MLEESGSVCEIKFLTIRDCDPNTVTPEILPQIRGDVASEVSQGEAHRVIKFGELSGRR